MRPVHASAIRCRWTRSIAGDGRPKSGLRRTSEWLPEGEYSRRPRNRAHTVGSPLSKYTVHPRTYFAPQAHPWCLRVADFVRAEVCQSVAGVPRVRSPEIHRRTFRGGSFTRPPLWGDRFAQRKDTEMSSLPPSLIARGCAVVAHESSSRRDNQTRSGRNTSTLRTGKTAIGAAGDPQGYADSRYLSRCTPEHGDPLSARAVTSFRV
jgi:hypothetical protein